MKRAYQRNPKYPQPLMLLGHQRENPRLQSVLEKWNIRDSVALVSAGWEEDEEDDQWVRDALDCQVVNTHLYRLADELFHQDPEVLTLLRERQDRLRELREVNELQTENLCVVARQLWQRQEQSAAAVFPLQQTIAQLRQIDVSYLQAVSTVIREFDQRIGSKRRPSVLAYREAVLKRIAGCQALLIAGGHVGVLLNRLNLCRLLRHVSLPIIAWSGGAMVLGQRVVFYDHFVPHAKREVELSRKGLNLFSGMQLFPRAAERLNLQDVCELTLLARRMDGECLVLDAHSQLEWTAHGRLNVENVRHVTSNGEVQEWRP